MARKRKAGDGTVRQRKDGRWEGRIVIGYDDNGYPKTKNVLAKTKKECLEKLQKLKEECGGQTPGVMGQSSFTGDGNIHREFIVSLYSRSTSTTAGGRTIFRIELFVLGVLS